MTLGRNFIYNLIGYLLPTLLAIATVPAYLHAIGAERYGVLAIAWLILGYFGLFDLGLGRATTQRIAALRDATPHERAVALDTALATNVAIGVIGAAILWPVAWYMFAHSMDMSPVLRAEAVAAAPLLGLAVPVGTTMGVLSGALSGREQFLNVNRISVTSTALFQLIPLGVALFVAPNLPLVLTASILARVIGLVMLWRACRREFGVVSGRLWDRGQLKGLLAYGGWVTLTALFGPLLVFADRFMIGALIGAVAVTVYVVPMEATRRLAGIANSMANTLFPRLAVASGEEALRLSALAVGTLYALLTAPVAGALFVMDPLMRLWVGDAIGSQAAPLARIFLIGYWFNTFANIPFARLQADGRPDVVSKFLLIETPFYFGGMWFGLHQAGLWGGAVVFAIRTVVDGSLMFAVANRRLDHAVTMLTSLALLTAASIWLKYHPVLDWTPAIIYGIAAALPFLWPSWRLMPPQLLAIIDKAMARVPLLTRLRGAGAKP